MGKFFGLLGLATLFVGTFTLAHGLKGYESINIMQCLYAIGIFLFGGILTRLSKNTITEMFPQSAAEAQRHAEIDRKAHIRKQKRKEKYSVKRAHRQQAFEQRTLQRKQAQLDKTQAHRQKIAESRIDKFIAKEGLSGTDARDVKTAVMDQFSDTLAFGPGKTVNHIHPAKLQIAVPVNPAQAYPSWLGGNPCLPQDMAWPTIEGKPCMFFAQIHCRDLPAGIWGGLGPKSGWLVFFASPDNFGKVKILHTHQIGIEKHAPNPPDHYGGYGDIRPVYNAIIGDSANLAPRWPLAITADLHSERYQEAHRLDETKKAAKDAFLKTDIHAAFTRPYNGPSFQGLIKAFDDYLEHETSARRKAIYGDVLHASRLQAQQTFRTLKAHTEQALVANGFYPELLGYFLQGLAQIPTQNWWTSHQSGREAYLGQHSEPIRHYVLFLETYLRLQYTQNPASIPQSYKQSWEQFWQLSTDHEAAYMGGQTHKFYSGNMHNPICLLELPTSGLMGWGFGDLEHLAFFIKAKDLKAGNWDSAWGGVSN